MLALLLLLMIPLAGFAAEQMIPAGSLVQCTVSEPKLSSKTTDVGDPVLCQVGHVELYGRSVLPYGSYLEGRFEDYKDPGHLVGKGWMELKFDRMFIPPGQIIPVSAKVVYVPKYEVDKQGRILGKGHAVRDTVEWLIPVLWPVDLLNLPRRGPRPVLKPETRLTLKIMDDFGVPVPEQTYSQQTPPPAYPYSAPRDSYGFYQRAPMNYRPAFSGGLLGGRRGAGALCELERLAGDYSAGDVGLAGDGGRESQAGSGVHDSYGFPLKHSRIFAEEQAVRSFTVD
jgi:hypothetical protein